AEGEEEQRLLYVALTRAREHLIVSGSVKLDPWPEPVPGREPIRWLAPALVPEIADADAPSGVAGRIAWQINRPETFDALPSPQPTTATNEGGPEPPPDTGGSDFRYQSAKIAATAPAAISFTALEAHARCGYRYYVEEILGLPRAPEGSGAGGELAGAERGALVHTLLEAFDFGAPTRPADDAVEAAARAAGIALNAEQRSEIADLVAAFARSPLCARLAHADRAAREERFAFLLGDALLVGVLDVVAREGDRALVVDYKTNRLLDREP